MLRYLFLSRELLEDSGGEEVEDDFQFTLYLCISAMLVLMAGLMSGLTLGLMSLDMVELEVLKRSGTAEEKRHAAVIMPVVKNQHLLLVTLLLCNAASTEALPLFIDRLADPFTAVLVSVSVVLVFGEILPQAICSRYGLKVGAYSAWFVRALMVLCSPIAWPISKLLDVVLGADHSALFRRAQLKALVDVHASGAGFGGTLSEDEIHIIRGALDLTSKTAGKSMTPLDKVFMLSTEDRLDERTMQAILLSGHSRIPVYRDGNRKDILGLILSKELVLINPAEQVPVRAMKMRELPRLSADTPMYDMLKLFETGKSHMALLTAPTSRSLEGSKGGSQGADGAAAGGSGSAGRLSPFPSLAYPNADEQYGGQYSGSGAYGPNAPVGIITIEDVIEELLQEEIIDETDLFVDNLQTSRVNAAAVAGTLPPRLKKFINQGYFTPRVGRLGVPPPRMLPPMSDPLVDAEYGAESELMSQGSGGSSGGGQQHPAAGRSSASGGDAGGGLRPPLPRRPSKGNGSSIGGSVAGLGPGTAAVVAAPSGAVAAASLAAWGQAEERNSPRLRGPSRGGSGSDREKDREARQPLLGPSGLGSSSSPGPL